MPTDGASADPPWGVQACGAHCLKVPYCHAITPPYLPVEAQSWPPRGGGGARPVYPGIPGLSGGVRGDTGGVRETLATKFPLASQCSRWHDCKSGDSGTKSAGPCPMGPGV